MSGFDAGFHYSETATVHQHIHVVALVEPDPAVTFESFVAAVVDRLALLPPLRRRTVHVPFGLHHPVWVTVPGIDVDQHFRRTPIGGTGSRRDLEELVGSIAGTALDKGHPLWVFHYCEGLADGRVAVVAKTHHSLADGVAITALLESAFTPSGVHAEPGATESNPSRATLVREALRDAVLQLRLLPGLLLRTLRGLRSARRYLRQHQVTVPGPLRSTPSISFNRRLTARRAFATATIPLTEFRSVQAQYDDVTLNDLVLGCVSGALRRWLQVHGEQPSRSMTVGIPVSLDARNDPRRLTGNLLGNVFGTLATDIDDPAERLRAIATTMLHAKEVDRRRGSAMMMDWFQFLPGGPVSLGVRAHAGLRIPDLLPPPFCLQVSNLPGPSVPMAAGPVRISDLFMVGQLVQGNGLAVLVWSYEDRMNFSLLTCPDLLPDVEVLASYLPDALADYAHLRA